MDGSTARILFVDDDPYVLVALERMLGQHSDGWESHFCLSADEALTVLDAVEVDTIVTDVRMPGKDGFQFLKAVRASSRTQRVPVIVVTGDCDTKLKRRAPDLGATDLLNKPVNCEDLVARIRSTLRLKSYEDHIAGKVETLDQMVKARTNELEAAQREMVWRLAKACEHRDDETGNHVVRVACYSQLIAKRLGKVQDFVDLLFLTSPLHDIGKIGIPDSILLKKERLTPEERRVIERHTTIGQEILSGAPKTQDSYGTNGMSRLVLANEPSQYPLMKMAASIAMGHHERWDGSGYPQGLAQEAIPIEARIVALADVYDALRSVRPYKPAYPEEKSVAIVREESGRHFDPDVVAAFAESLNEIHEIGSHFAGTAASEWLGV